MQQPQISYHRIKQITLSDVRVFDPSHQSEGFAVRTLLITDTDGRVHSVELFAQDASQLEIT